MILVINLNASVDKRYKMKDLIKGEVMRAAEVDNRSCLAIITESGAQTEILEPGPTVNPEEQEAFMAKYQELLSKAAVVAASGSMPKGLLGDFYGQLISLAH